MPRRNHIARLVPAVALAASTATTVWAQGVSPDLYDQLEFRHIGPVGNRLSAVAGVPGDPLVYYAGAASGGLWKSEDGGFRWKSVSFNRRSYSSRRPSRIDCTSRACSVGGKSATATSLASHQMRKVNIDGRDPER